MERKKTRAEAEQFIQNVARLRGWVANPDESFREVLSEGLATNANRYGYFLCPCRDGEGDRRADKDIVCPCVYAKADIQEYGQCFCGLFLSREKAQQDAEPEQIPERRYQ
jgi:ferredoxin-thioredoxin reductase catalytic subunit